MTTTTLQPISRTVESRGVQTYVVEQGAGAPILFLHGAPDSADMWAGVIETLAGRFRCIAADLPGFGRSTAPEDFDYSLENQARWVDGVVSALGLDEPLALVMHDFGGHFGLAWAIRHPEKVRRLVISNTAFFSDYTWHSGARFLRLPVLGELGMRMTTYDSLATMMRGGSPNLSEAHLRATYGRFTASVRRAMLRLYRASDPRNFSGWEDELLALTRRTPTLVLWGDADPFAGPGWADRFGAGRVEHYGPYGHWLPVEAPGLVAAQIGAFV